jgi:hypothetical protein
MQGPRLSKVDKVLAPTIVQENQRAEAVLLVNSVDVDHRSAAHVDGEWAGDGLFTGALDSDAATILRQKRMAVAPAEDELFKSVRGQRYGALDPRLLRLVELVELSPDVPASPAPPVKGEEPRDAERHRDQK